MLIPKNIRPHYLLSTDPELPESLTHALLRDEKTLTASDGIAMLVCEVLAADEAKDTPCLVHRDVLEAASKTAPKDESEYLISRVESTQFDDDESGNHGEVTAWHEALQDGGVVVRSPVSHMISGSKPVALPAKLTEGTARLDVVFSVGSLAKLCKALGTDSVTLRIPATGNVACVFPGDDTESPTYGFLITRPKQLQLHIPPVDPEVAQLRTDVKLTEKPTKKAKRSH